MSDHNYTLWVASAYIYIYEYIGDKIYERDLSIFETMKKKVSKSDYRENNILLLTKMLYIFV